MALIYVKTHTPSRSGVSYIIQKLPDNLVERIILTQSNQTGLVSSRARLLYITYESCKAGRKNKYI
jgi:hypothetical protein